MEEVTNDDDINIISGEDLKQLEQYQEVYKKYKAKEDAPIVVMWHQGHFFNFLGFEDPDGTPWNNFRDIVKVLSLKITANRPKEQRSMGNPLKAGVPVISSEGRQQKLLQEGYILVICMQDPNDKTKRDVSRVVTPGTQLAELETPLSNFMVALYIENNNPKKDTIRVDRMSLSIGMCAIDVSTGKVLVHESSSKHDYDAEALDEAYRFLKATSAVEVLISANGFRRLSEQQQQDFRSHVQQHLNLGSFVVRRFKFDDPVDVNFSKPEYQTEVWTRLYGDKPCNLNMYGLSCSGLVACSSAIYEYRPSVLRGLSLPEVWSTSRHLILNHNSAEQLEILGRGKKKTDNLFRVLDNTYTALGSRLLQSWLLNPLIDQSCIQRRLDTVESLMALSEDQQTEFKKQLQAISVDLKRLLRRAELDNPHMELGINNFYNLYHGFIKVTELITMIAAIVDSNETTFKVLLDWLPNEQDVNNAYEFLDLVESTFDLVLLPNVVHIPDNAKDAQNQRIFIPGVNDSVLETRCAEIEALLHPVAPIIRKKAKTTAVSDKKVKKKLDANGMYFKVTAADSVLLKHYRDEVRNCKNKSKAKIIQWNDIKEYKTNCVSKKKKDAPADDEEEESNSDEERSENFKNILKAGSHPDKQSGRYLTAKQIAMIADMSISETKAYSKITFEETNNCYEIMQSASTTIRDTVVAAFNTFVANAIQRYQKNLEPLIDFVGEVDVLFSHARTAKMYQYHKPTLLPSDSIKRSSFNAKNLRHPIAERILQKNFEYVSNDVSIGAEENVNGLMLFGINNSGKTLLLKSVALAVVMAQSGCFVPASELRIRPFMNIITRLSGKDNMHGGQGTFAVEMSELTTILSLANAQTLVLGDEICHGTEYPSAISIVAASIKDMVQQNMNFLFATHLHALASMSGITALPTVQFKHFQVDTIVRLSGETEIIYNRKLQPGSGLATYGIEVAAAQGIPDRVIIEAHKIRRELLDEATTIVDTRTSHFNSAVVLDRCGVPNCKDKAVETHHIRFQSEADEDGVIDERFHKNSAWNLVGLCKAHHDDITHYNRLVIKGWAITLDGRRILMVENVTPTTTPPPNDVKTTTLSKYARKKKNN
jgi:DNA mismatch repair protein MutS